MPDAGDQPFPDLPDQGVSAFVAQRVVDPLETVQIEKEERSPLLRARILGSQETGQILHEGGSVGKPRQGIGERHRKEARLELLLFGQIPKNECDERSFTIAESAGGDLHRKERSVLAAALGFHDKPLGLPVLRKGSEGKIGKETGKRVSLDLGAADAEDPLGGGIEIENGPRRVDKDDSCNGRFRKGDEASFDSLGLGPKGVFEAQVFEEDEGLGFLLGWMDPGKGDPNRMGGLGGNSVSRENLKGPTKLSPTHDLRESLLQSFGSKNERERMAQNLGTRQSKLPEKSWIGR